LSAENENEDRSGVKLKQGRKKRFSLVFDCLTDTSGKYDCQFFRVLLVRLV